MEKMFHVLFDSVPLHISTCGNLLCSNPPPHGKASQYSCVCARTFTSAYALCFHGSPWYAAEQVSSVFIRGGRPREEVCSTTSSPSAFN